jgi:uncharacterized membrane protein
MLDALPGAWYRSPVALEPPYESVSEREIVSGRALAAVAYLPGLCFIGLLDAPRNRYVRFHARQGLVLLGIEVTAWIALVIVESALGRIPILGIVASVLLRLILGFAFLGATLYGVIKGASGDMVRIPFLGDIADQLGIE